MMKKILSLLLTAVMILPIAGCGSEVKSMSVEEMAEQAKTVNGASMGMAVSNVAKAQADYCDQLIQVDGEIDEIGADYVVLNLKDEDQIYATLRAAVPGEELMDLVQSQRVSVVGSVDQEIDKTEDLFGFETMMYTMSEAHISKTTMEWTGVIHSENSSFKHGYNFKVGDSVYLRLVYFDKEETPEINGEEITISGRVIAGQMHGGVIVK